MPAAVGDEAAVELAPVFEVLDEFEREAALARERSERMTARRLHEAREAVNEIITDARHRADSERDDALKGGLRAADVAAAEIVAEAEADAHAVDRRGALRLPGVVAEVVRRVKETGS